MTSSFEDLQRAHDNETPEDRTWRPRTEEERGELAENEAMRREDRE